MPEVAGGGQEEFSVGDVTVREGEVISLDGSTGEVMIGALELTAAKPTKESMKEISNADFLMDMANSPITMERSMKVNGFAEKNKARENILMQII